MKHSVQIFLVVFVLLVSTRRSFAPISPGSLTVNILPASAVAAGAKWQMDGAAPQDSGTTNQFISGNHTVTFTSIYGWASPASLVVNVPLGPTTVTNGTYALTNAPLLTVKRTLTNTVSIAWSSAWTNWGLQQNTNLAPTNWVTSAAAIADNGTNKSVIITNSPLGKIFFRLKL